jgi:dynactin-4
MVPEIFCPCRESDNEVNPDSKSQLNIPNTIWDRSTRHKLEYLYFCNGCKTFRCQYCVEQDIITRYCPSCLFEVPAATAKRDNNRCMRNCFWCPKCYSTATVVGSGKEESRKYSIDCTHCEWKTGSKYDKQSPLVSQILNEPCYRDDVSLFANLRSTYGALTREPSKRDKKKLSDSQLSAGIANLSLNDDSEISPLLQSLRVKTSKACKVCKRILTKPEPRPASTKFKIKLLALNYLPQLDLSAFKGEIPTVLHDGETTKLLLTITNPMTVSLKVNVAVVPGSVKNHPHSVTIANPNIELGPASELWDEMSLIRGVPRSRITRETNASRRHFVELQRHNGQGGLHDKGPNWATVAVEYTVSAKVPDAEMALFISFSYLEEEVQKEEVPTGLESTEKLKVSQNSEESDDAEDSSNESNAQSSGRTEVGFWAIFTIAKTAGLIEP